MCTIMYIAFVGNRIIMFCASGVGQKESFALFSYWFVIWVAGKKHSLKDASRLTGLTVYWQKLLPISDQKIIWYLSDSGKTYRSLSSISNTSLDATQEEASLTQKVEQISVQSEWLKQNQKILASLYEHCLMVGTRDPELPGEFPSWTLVDSEYDLKLVCQTKLFTVIISLSSKPNSQTSDINNFFPFC